LTLPTTIVHIVVGIVMDLKITTTQLMKVVVDSLTPTTLIPKVTSGLLDVTMDTRIIVKRRYGTIYGTVARGTHKGSGYCEEHWDRQYLTKEWRLFGIRIWSWVLDTEEVPVWASAQKATCGYTEWKSKFAEYI